MKQNRQKKHKACFTDKYRKRMKKQQPAKDHRKKERERRRHEEERRSRGLPFIIPATEEVRIERDRLRHRLRDILMERIYELNFYAPGFETDLPTEAEIEEAETAVAEEDSMAETLMLPEDNATAVSPVCPLCNMVITPDHYRYNVKTVTFQGKRILVHTVCPNEPGYVWLREGSPGSGRFA